VCSSDLLFNNGKITLTGAKNESDGYYASCVLLNELKKDINIFLDLKETDIKIDDARDITEINNEREEKLQIFNNLKIVNYKITMINSDFDTNFKIDLIKLLNILNSNEKELFTKFNPEKYRGLIIGYYWNTNKSIQDGKCVCKSKCNGKGTGTGEGQCKKITISIFKSGSVIITGGRLVKQIEDAYKSINDIFKQYYHDIIKLSILDFMDNDDSDIELNEKEENIEIDEIKPKINNTKKIIVKKISNNKDKIDHYNINENISLEKTHINETKKIIKIKIKKIK
jgi:TATA-box binding protein (TBP) (component of TFIID and TFIIIB)